MSTAAKRWVWGSVGLACLAGWSMMGPPAKAATPPLATHGIYYAQPQAGQPAAEIGRGYFTLTLKPGQVKSMAVVVKNTGAYPVTLRDYLANGVQSPPGGVGYSLWGTPLTGAGAWIHLDARSVTLAPGKSRLVSATITVPKGAAPGQHVTGLALENTGIRNRGIKKAPFIVLIGANMPSILAEISFVSNPTDERKLETSEHRQRIAESLYRGVSKYVNGLSGVKVASKIDKSEGQ